MLLLLQRRILCAPERKEGDTDDRINREKVKREKAKGQNTEYRSQETECRKPGFATMSDLKKQNQSPPLAGNSKH